MTERGSLFSCGWGADGQTGLGHYDNQSSPSQIGGDVKNEKIVKVACASDCVLALNGKTFTFLSSKNLSVSCRVDLKKLG
jgi:hypothetical protein